MHIRAYPVSDLSGLVDLFNASVHGLTGDQYPAAQRSAWAPDAPDLAEWGKRLQKGHVYVAEMGAALAGFIAYESDGHIDLLYTSPDHAGRGVASALMHYAESALKSRGRDQVYTEASRVARRFFEHQGFQVEEEQTLLRNGVELPGFAMRKKL